MKRLRLILPVCMMVGLGIAVGCSRQSDSQAPVSRPTAPLRAKGAEKEEKADFSVAQNLDTQPLTRVEPAEAPSKNGEPVRAGVDQLKTGAAVPAMQRDAPERVKKGKDSAGHNGKKKREADEIFDQCQLLRIQIEIPAAGLSALRQTRWENKQQRPTAQVTIREGDQIYTNVAVHLKGAAGSFRPVDGKPAMTLNFDKFAPGQSFHGLHKISLNNSAQDGSYLCEKIARELFIAAGVPAPRAGHALVALNGRPLGLYVVLEGANKQFLKRYFDDVRGNLYDGGFCRDISSRLAVNCGDDPNNHAGLRALRSAVSSGSYAKLEKALDLDRFYSMVALEMMLCHWDGYTLNRNNWRIFHDLGSNRMVFIPHGLDQLFGGGGRFGENNSLLPSRAQGEVARAVLSTKEGQQAYLDKAAAVYTNVFRVEKIMARIDEIVGKVAPAVAESDPQVARMFQQRAHTLKMRISRRAEDLRQNMGEPLEVVEFGHDGVLPLPNWTNSVVLTGNPVLSKADEPNGHTRLMINAGDAASSSSWRTSVVLGPGQYEFQGRVRVKGVTVEEGDQRSGAGLRISKGVMPHKLTGTTPWQECKYRFTVPRTGADVELVCELKATAGEAWFDVSSLRIIKVQ